MDLICGWCTRPLGALGSGPGISHGVCPTCRIQEEQDTYGLLVARREACGYALLLVDGEGRIEHANSRAAAFLGRPLASLAGALLVDCLPCHTADLSAGCPCTACALQDLVRATRRSGVSRRLTLEVWSGHGRAPGPVQATTLPLGRSLALRLSDRASLQGMESLPWRDPRNVLGRTPTRPWACSPDHASATHRTDTGPRP